MEVIKLFSFSTQLSMKFKMLINIEKAKIHGFSGLYQQSLSFILLINVKMPTIVWHFNIYEQDKFHAQLS